MKKNNTQKHGRMFRQSMNELKVTRNMVLCGLMAALAVIMGTFASVKIGPYLKIGFSEYPNRIVEFIKDRRFTGYRKVPKCFLLIKNQLFERNTRIY